MTELKVKKGEPLERVLRRLKKRLDREGVIREVRNHRYFEKPCEKRRRKMKVARFSAMLAARYAVVISVFHISHINLCRKTFLPG